MSGLSSLLYVGASGLNASQQAIRTASDNIANVDTPGFRRRELLTSTAPSSPVGGVNVGGGVQVDGTQRIVDNVLDRRVRDAGAEVGFAEARADILRQAEVVFGDLEGNGLSGALDNLFSTFDQLATEPQDTGARQRVLEGAERFANELNFVAGELETQQLDLDRRLDEQVDRINELSREIAQLNLSIGRDTEPPPDLLDRRDYAVMELGKLVGVDVIESSGQLTVSLTGSGFGLVVDGAVRPLTASTASGQAVISGERNGTTLDLTDSLSGGQLTGTIEGRNVDLQSMIDQVDLFAFDVGTAINGVHGAGYGLDGATGRPLFTVTATPAGAAGGFAVDAAVAGQPDLIAAATDPLLLPGDNRGALALAELRTTALAGGESAGDTLRGVLGDFGARLSEATVSLEARSAAEGRLEELQSELSGVSLDEEMTKLLQFRQSYAAAARVIQTADELMQEVVALKR